MKMDRRGFLRIAGGAVASSLAMGNGKALAGRAPKTPPDPRGCLVDLTECVGCRKCEQACNQVNGLPEPKVPFDDLTVLDHKRRPDEKAFTVINRYWTGRRDDRNQFAPSFVKVQCMHCQDPACVSRLYRRGIDQASQWGGPLRCLQMHRLPLLHGGVPLPDPSLRVSRSLNTAGDEVHLLL
jgi:hypothetical protein